MKSWLFVPGDDRRKLEKASSVGADALILDLEDSVLPERKPVARNLLAEVVARYTGPSQIWVRVNDLESGELLRDLAAAIPLAPSGILLPKIRRPEDLETVGHYLDAAEACAGLGVGSTGIVALCTETPEAVLRLGDIVAQRYSRLRGLSWGAEDLSSALGATHLHEDSGAWAPVYAHARTQCLLAAHALGVLALDTVYVDFKDEVGCRTSCEQAKRDGFVGKLAIHPAQVPVINDAFRPDAEEIAFARRVVAAFDSSRGAVSLDGRMLDLPHLKRAQRVLALMSQKGPDFS